MLKLLILYFLVTCAITLADDIFIQAAKKCIRTSGVKQESIFKAKIGDYDGSQEFKDFILCYGKEMTICKDDGLVSPEIFKIVYKDKIHGDLLERISKECPKRYSNAAETAYMFFICVSKYTKILFLNAI